MTLTKQDLSNIKEALKPEFIKVEERIKQALQPEFAKSEERIKQALQPEFAKITKRLDKVEKGLKKLTRDNRREHNMIIGQLDIADHKLMKRVDKIESHLNLPAFV